MSKIENPKLIFAGYKTGSPLSFQIEPLCHEVEKPVSQEFNDKTTVQVGTKKVMECMPHADTPEKLQAMFDEMYPILSKHGFDIQIFGSPKAMYERMKKKDVIELSKLVALNNSIDLVIKNLGEMASRFKSEESYGSEEMANDSANLLIAVTNLFPLKEYQNET